jgi:hypothetical protein
MSGKTGKFMVKYEWLLWLLALKEVNKELEYYALLYSVQNCLHNESLNSEI